MSSKDLEEMHRRIDEFRAELMAELGLSQPEPDPEPAMVDTHEIPVYPLVPMGSVGHTFRAGVLVVLSDLSHTVREYKSAWRAPEVRSDFESKLQALVDDYDHAIDLAMRPA